jgi:uncharacterized protein (DUF885 family)
MRRGLETGFTQPRLTTLNAIASIRAQLQQSPDHSSLLLPLAKLPPTISEGRKSELRAKAAKILHDEVQPSQRVVLKFLETEYLPRTRDSYGISSVPAEGTIMHI